MNMSEKKQIFNRTCDMRFGQFGSHSFPDSGFQATPVSLRGLRAHVRPDKYRMLRAFIWKFNKDELELCLFRHLKANPSFTILKMVLFVLVFPSRL